LFEVLLLARGVGRRRLQLYGRAIDAHPGQPCADARRRGRADTQLGGRHALQTSPLGVWEHLML